MNMYICMYIYTMATYASCVAGLVIHATLLGAGRLRQGPGRGAFGLEGIQELLKSPG